MSITYSRRRHFLHPSQALFALTFKMAPMTFFIAGCLHKSTDGTLLNAPQGAVQTTTKPKIVFNWSKDSGSLHQHLRSQAQDAQAKNRDIKTNEDLPQLGQQGYGLYVTMDPFASLLYGTELSCLSVKTNTTWVDNNLVRGESVLANLRGPSDLILYGWGTSFLEGQKKTALSAVIRNPRLVDINQSAKFSMNEYGSGDGLGSAKIAKAKQRLQSGNWCQAFSTFENEYGTFSMAFSAAYPFGASKARYRDALGAHWLMTPGFLAQNPVPSRGIEMIEKNSPLVRELTEAGILEGKNSESRKSEMNLLFSKAFIHPPGLIPGGLPEAQIPARIALLTRLFNETGIFPLSGHPTTMDTFTEALNEACYQFVSHWGQTHPQDVALAKDLIAIMLHNGLSGMSEQVPWPD